VLSAQTSDNNTVGRLIAQPQLPLPDQVSTLNPAVERGVMNGHQVPVPLLRSELSPGQKIDEPAKAGPPATCSRSKSCNGSLTPQH